MRETDSRDPGPELLRAYLNAEYVIETPAGFRVLRVGETAALPVEGTPAFAVITAANPASVALPEDENARRHEALLRLLRRLQLPAWPGVNRSIDGTHAETSVLALGLTALAADHLASRFGQYAIVAGRAGDPARLRCYQRAWRDANAKAHVDTAFVDWVA